MARHSAPGTCLLCMQAASYLVSVSAQPPCFLLSTSPRYVNNGHLRQHNHMTRYLPSRQIAPASIRGLLTLQYACCQQLGVVFGFFFNYGITKHHAGTQLQWQLPTALQIIPAVIWAAGIICTPETPRFLLSKNKETEALKVLCEMRRLPEHHPYITDEFAGIQMQLNHEIEAVAGASTWDLLKETFTITEYRRRFILMFCCHLFSQWSGANAITQVHTPSRFPRTIHVNTSSSILRPSSATWAFRARNRASSPRASTQSSNSSPFSASLSSSLTSSAAVAH